jgi:single-strand DNA-binding protein
MGNLGADVDLKFGASGTAIANLRVATNMKYKDKDGNPVEKVEWHRVTVFGKSAENCAKYLSKGRMVHVTGRLQTRSWEKDGVRRYTTEIIAGNVQFLGGKKSEDTQTPAVPEGDPGVDETDIPL